MSIALLAECLDTALCSGYDEQDGLEEISTGTEAVSESEHSSLSSCLSSFSSSSQNLETTRAAAPTTSEPVSSKRKTRRKYLSSSKRNTVLKHLSEINSDSAADSIIAEAQAELHMSEYTSRKQSLDVSRSTWVAVVGSLLDLYRKLYVECAASATADRYSTFQVRWVTGVSNLLSTPTLASLCLELQDTSSVFALFGCCGLETLL